MEFWGVEVKSGEVIDVKIGERRSLHLDQACLGANDEKTHDPVHLHIIVDGKKHVLATLYPKSLTTQKFNLMFVENFKLSHDMKNGSVHFFGTQYRQFRPLLPYEFLSPSATMDALDVYIGDLDYEVSGCQKLNVKVDKGTIVRITKACLGEIREEIDGNVYLHISVDGKQHVAGEMNPHSQPQQDLYLTFDKDFEIFHTWSNGIVYISGFQFEDVLDYSSCKSDTDSDDDEEKETTKKKLGVCRNCNRMLVC